MIFLKDMPFMETLREDHYAGLFGNSTSLEDLSISDFSRISSDLTSVKRVSGLMGIISLMSLKISAM